MGRGMELLLLIAGTTEGRELFNRLKGTGVKMAVSFLTDYGIDLLMSANDSNTELLKGPLDKQRLINLIQGKKITKIIDASHPFAVEISKNAMEAARDRGVDYLRFERPPSILPEHPLIKRVRGFQEAAEEAVRYGKAIFLTIGVRNLEPFVSQAKKHGIEVIARILPMESSLKICREKGLKPSQIIALQGSGSRELNKELLKSFCAGVLVTKDSGTAGGAAAKIEAAVDLNIPVIFIERPHLDYGENLYCQMDDLIREVLNNTW